ncbi:sugar kinase [Pradoshia eiseniae]|uniref:Sugar kinase n=1 Tax=Pradoshia eiseniae TaxID=2064768 RepID=A0A2S7N0W8_9BACI|nr:sugar kinase [Pradoshia eiseniae]PQD95732.1 sugar kinase [Pradoshia eiseniae]
MSKVDVVTVGESMVLFQPITDNSLNYAPLFMKSLAGAESNVAITLARLQKKVRWISKLGKDPFGDFILSTLAGEGIDVSRVKREVHKNTAICFKENKGYGDPNVYYYRKNSAASLFSQEDVKEDWFENALHLHVTGITPALGENTVEFIREVMVFARKQGLSISFDPNLRRKLWTEEKAKEVLLSLIPLCDIFMPGLEEAEFLLGNQSVENYGKQFIEMGPKIVALKLGEQGSKGFYKDQIIESSAYKVNRIVDTVGAGDAFAAGLLSVLLEEENLASHEGILRSLHHALRRANILGALATQYKGDWDGAPNLEEILLIENEKQIPSR